MRCPNCGNENPDDYTFCDECGARLTPAEGENTDSAEATASGASPEPAYAQSGSAVGQGYQPMAAEAQATGTGGAPDAPSQPLSPAGAGMDAPTGAVCPSCGAPTVPGEAYCSECGAELPAG